MFDPPHPAKPLSLSLVMCGFFAATPALGVSTPQYYSFKAGQARAWQGAKAVTKYSSVSLRYGNLHTTIPLIGWTGTGPATGMVFYHNSLAPVSGLSTPATSYNLGAGWSSTYSARIHTIYDQNNPPTEYQYKLLIDDDGTVVRFDQDDVNWVCSTPGFHLTLTQDDSDWIITAKDKSYRRFNNSGKLLEVVDASGNVATVDYNSNGTTHKVTDATANGGRPLDFHYDDNTHGTRLTSITAPLDGTNVRTWTLDYTTNGRLETIHDPMDHTIQFVYDSAARIRRVYDELGNYSLITYEHGLVASVNDPSPYDAQVQAFTYESDATRPYDRVYTDRRGHNWTYTFDGNTNGFEDNLVSATDPLSHTTSWTRDGDHNLLTATDALSNVMTYTYDSAGNMLTSEDPLGNVTSYTYHATFNKVTQRTDPDEVSPSRRITIYDYNTNTGLLTSVTDATTHTTSYAYYGAGDHPEWNGLLKTQTDRLGIVTLYSYDDYGQLASVTVDHGTGKLNLLTQYVNNKAGFRTQMTDPNGVVTDYTYDNLGRSTIILVDSGEGKLNLETSHAYDDAGRRLWTKNPRGTVTTHAYDNLDRVTQTTQDANTCGNSSRLNYVSTFDYNSNGQRIQQTDANSNVVQWAYDDAGRVSSTTDAESNETVFAYDAAGNRTTVTDANEHVTLTTYDALNRVTQVQVDPTGLDLTTQYEYAVSGGGGGCGCGGGVGKGLVRHMIDADGKHTFYKYDVLDRRTHVIRKVGDTSADADTNDAVTQSSYDLEGRLTQTTVQVDPDHTLVTTTVYDNAGRVTERHVDPGGGSHLNLTTLYDYDSNGNTLHVSSPTGDVTTNSYDAANRRTETADTLGAVEALVYDANGNVVERHVPGPTGDVYSTMEYDALDRMSSVTDPLTYSTTYTHDGTGHVLTVTDGNSHVITYVYDGTYRKTQVIDALGNTVDYTYDPVGNLWSQTASNGGFDSQVTSYDYDEANRRVTETYPDDESGVNVRTFTYTGTGQVARRMDQNGDVTSNGYDDLHRLTRRSYEIGESSPSYPADQPPDVFTYDLAGRMLTATHDPEGDAYADSFVYDAGGAITAFTQGGFEIDCEYTVDASTNRRVVTYPGGLVIAETADQRGRITSVKDVTTSGQPTLAANTYDAGDRLAYRVFGNATQAAWTYDDAGRVGWVTHANTNGSNPFVDLSYERDKVGNPSCREDHVTSNLSEIYAYDAADRLIDFQRGDINTSDCSLVSTNGNSALLSHQAWTLDALGNWSTNGCAFGVRDMVNEYRTHNKANEITDIDTRTPTHDDNGNLTYDGTTYSYSYDAENRLTLVMQGETAIAEYFYDALGRRVKKVVTNTDDFDGTYNYVWNPDWQLMEVYKDDEDHAPVLAQAFVHAGAPRAWYGNVGGGRAYVDDHVAMYKVGAYGIGDSAGRYYYHTDAQFTTMAVTNKDRVVAASYIVSAYGMIESTTIAGGGGLGGYATNNAMVHQGLLADAETGSYYNRRRNFLPSLGRFAQRDPIGYADGMTLYSYEHSDPAARRDPTGLACLNGFGGCASGGGDNPPASSEPIGVGADWWWFPGDWPPNAEPHIPCNKEMLNDAISRSAIFQFIRGLFDACGCEIPTVTCGPCDGGNAESSYDPKTNSICISDSTQSNLLHEYIHAWQTCYAKCNGWGERCQCHGRRLSLVRFYPIPLAPVIILQRAKPSRLGTPIALTGLHILRDANVPH